MKFPKDKRVKLKCFYDTEETCFNSGGSSYIKFTSVFEQVEPFINDPKIEVIDIKYNAYRGKDQNILVIYTERNEDNDRQ